MCTVMEIHQQGIMNFSFDQSSRTDAAIHEAIPLAWRKTDNLIYNINTTK